MIEFKFDENYKPIAFLEFMKNNHKGIVLEKETDGYYALSPLDEEE